MLLRVERLSAEVDDRPLNLADVIKARAVPGRPRGVAVHQLRTERSHLGTDEKPLSIVLTQSVGTIEADVLAKRHIVIH